MLIINADDFGHSPETNEAIATAFGKGLISSSTMMANEPGFEDACRIAKAMGLADRIGIHLNITEGHPLTADITRFPIFCDSEGLFCFKRETHIVYRPREIAALRREIQAQIDRCRAFGLKLTHADSHHHVHTELPILLAIAPVLRRNGIPFLRLTDNVRRSSLWRRMYKFVLNRTITLLGLRGADYFCDLKNLDRIRDRALRDEIVAEVMVHADWAENGNLIDSTTNMPLAVAVRDLERFNEPRSYGDLKRRNRAAGTENN